MRRSAVVRRRGGAERSVAMANALQCLGIAREHTGQHEASLPLFERSLAIKEQALGAEHPAVGATLYNMAVLRQIMGQHEAALALYERASAVFVATGRDDAVSRYAAGQCRR